MSYHYGIGNSRKGSGLLKRIFFGGYNEINETLRWTIECADGRHSIGLRLGEDIRMGKSIYIDGDYLTNITYEGRKFLPEDTYDFECHGEQVKLVFYRNKVYLVHRGMIHGTKKKYDPDRKFPMIVRILLTLMTLASVAVSFVISASMGESRVIIAMIFAAPLQIALAGAVLNVTGNPFYTTVGKLLAILGLLLGTWAIACFLPLFVLEANINFS